VEVNGVAGEVAFRPAPVTVFDDETRIGGQNEIAGLAFDELESPFLEQLPSMFRYANFGSAAVTDAPGRRERLPAHAPLRTVRDSFPSHGSSLASPDLLRRPGGIQAKGSIVPFAWALRAFQRMRQTKQRRFWKYSVSIGS
jgi:hypothetical protein